MSDRAHFCETVDTTVCKRSMSNLEKGLWIVMALYVVAVFIVIDRAGQGILSFDPITVLLRMSLISLILSIGVVLLKGSKLGRELRRGSTWVLALAYFLCAILSLFSAYHASAAF